MSKKIFTLLTVLLIASVALAACGGGDAEVEATAKICEVTDVGGIDDKSFNATAWKGVEDAIADFGVEGQFLESQQQTDYESHINTFVEEGCDLIVTVGFLLGDATAAGAAANPDQKFAIIDVNWLAFDNLVGLDFAIDEAAFLAGYVAADNTVTGKVGTFGGINIPPVVAFMDGFAYGVAYYNAEHGTAVEVLGWDVEAQDGLFTGNFESADDGRAMGESLMDEGADIIMPVAGPVGLGTAAAIQERGNAWIIGVDNDWKLSNPDYADIVLTSVLKNMDRGIYETVEKVVNDTFEAGLWVGNLANGGVGIAGDFDVQSIIDGIIDGTIATAP